jgi:hypothetical protein
MIALDGNAIADDLRGAFGVDLTAATCVCGACGMSSVVAEAIVYMRGPGRVARCRGCSELLLVLVTDPRRHVRRPSRIAGFEIEI